MSRVVLEYIFAEGARKAANILEVTAFDPEIEPLTADEVYDTIDAQGSLMAGVTGDVLLQTITVSNPTTETVNTDGKGGEFTGSAVPSNTAFLVRKLGGPRKRQGRMFLPGPAEAEVDSAGFLDTTYLAVAQAGVTDWFQRMAAKGFDIRQGDPEGTGQSGAIVTGLTVAPQVATQRRRMRA